MDKSIKVTDKTHITNSVEKLYHNIENEYALSIIKQAVSSIDRSAQPQIIECAIKLTNDIEHEYGKSNLIACFLNLNFTEDPFCLVDQVLDLSQGISSGYIRKNILIRLFEMQPNKRDHFIKLVKTICKDYTNTNDRYDTLMQMA